MRHALEDLQVVVEDGLGGTVLAWLPADRGAWLTLDEALDSCRPRELVDVLTFYPFLGVDWQEKLQREHQEHEEQRRRSGVTPYKVIITSDPSDYRSAVKAETWIPVADGIDDDYVQILIDELGYTQAKLGELFGVTRSAVQKWLHNGPPPQYIPLLVRLGTTKGEEPPTEEELRSIGRRGRGRRRG